MRRGEWRICSPVYNGRWSWPGPGGGPGACCWLTFIEQCILHFLQPHQLHGLPIPVTTIIRPSKEHKFKQVPTYVWSFLHSHTSTHFYLCTSNIIHHMWPASHTHLHTLQHQYIYVWCVLLTPLTSATTPCVIFSMVPLAPAMWTCQMTKPDKCYPFCLIQFELPVMDTVTHSHSRHPY